MLGATHACANPLTTRYGTPHGIAISLLLPHVVRWNAAAARDGYAELCGDRGRPRRAATPAGALADRLEELAVRAGLPRRLRSVGVGEGDLAGAGRTTRPSSGPAASTRGRSTPRAPTSCTARRSRSESEVRWPRAAASNLPGGPRRLVRLARATPRLGTDGPARRLLAPVPPRSAAHGRHARPRCRLRCASFGATRRATPSTRRPRSSAGAVYVGSHAGHLLGLDLATGALRFKYAAGAEIGESSPTVAARHRLRRRPRRASSTPWGPRTARAVGRSRRARRSSRRRSWPKARS